jgi:hypothetical protein
MNGKGSKRRPETKEERASIDRSRLYCQITRHERYGGFRESCKQCQALEESKRRKTVKKAQK